MRSLTWFLVGTPLAVLAAAWWLRSSRRRRELQSATNTRKAVQRETEASVIAGTAEHRSEIQPPSTSMPHLSPRAPEGSHLDDAARPKRGVNDPTEAMSVGEQWSGFATSAQSQPEPGVVAGSEPTADVAAPPPSLVESEAGSRNSVTRLSTAESGSDLLLAPLGTEPSQVVAQITEVVSSPQVGDDERRAATIEAALPGGEGGASPGDPPQVTTSDNEERRPAICPRCGMSCPAEDEERVFGFRTMRSTNARGEQTFVVRRQSYCRRCRTEHAVAMRERRVLDDHEKSGPAPSTPTLAVDAEHEAEVSDEAAATEGVRELTGVDVESLESASGQIAAESVEVEDDRDSLENQPFEQSPSTPLSADRPRTARQYRAPSSGRPSSRLMAGKTKTRTEATSRDGTTAFDLRVLFNRQGGCSISLLPRRPAGWPETVQISIGADSFEVDLLQEGWYEEIRPNDMGSVLRQGVVGVDADREREWQLTGREVFAFASCSDLRGFVSCPRLQISRDHVVLCHSSRVHDVEAILREAGCSGWTRPLEDGIPSEWTLLRHVLPGRAVMPNEVSDILNILRPVPEIDIQLEGGVRLEHNNWLLGCHPTIRIYGAQDHAQDVVIDGQVAVPGASGGFSVPGTTELGDHQIWCSGITKRFSIVNRPLPSQLWSAYRFGSGSHREAFTVCGPFVHHVAKAPLSVDEEDISAVQVVPISHRVLIGANPGEIQIAPARPGAIRMPCVTRVPFEPVWGLPLSLLADKRRASVRLLAARLSSAGPSEIPLQVPRDRAKAVRLWCSYVLDASRKGLALEPQSPDVAALWRRYRDRARQVRRRLK
jgi:hypothetical protein